MGQAWSTESVCASLLPKRVTPFGQICMSGISQTGGGPPCAGIGGRGGQPRAMLPLLLLYVSMFSSVWVRSTGESDEKFFGSIARLEQCKDTDDLLIKVHKMYFNYKGDNIYTLTFNLSMNEDLNKPLDMRFEVKKCGSENGPCEDFVNHTMEDLCTELEDEGSIPHSLFKMAKLPLKCPISKGKYIADKSEIKIHPELLEVGKYGNYWKFKLYLMRGPDKPIFCLYVEGKVAKMAKGRKKKRRGH